MVIHQLKHRHSFLGELQIRNSVLLELNFFGD
jgi:hypothetical protein